jgi:hypothetical protein
VVLPLVPVDKERPSEDTVSAITGPEHEGSCATCGRSLAESPEAFRSGRLSFCSKFCGLQHEVVLATRSGAQAGSSGAKGAHPRVGPRLGRTSRWFLVFIGALVVASVVALFVRSSGGEPVGMSQAQGFGNWSVRVLSVNGNDGPAPSHARDVSVTLSLKYLGAGEASPPFDFYTERKHGARYLAHWLAPLVPPILPRVKPGVNARAACVLAGDRHDLSPRPSATVFSGASDRVFACFQVATNDLSSLRLYVKQGRSQPVAFALRTD